MTRFLLRWQVLFLKRHLLSLQGLIPLIVNLIFQAIILTSVLVSPKDFTSTVTMFVVYTGAFGISQTSTVYNQALDVTTSGLLGVAPIPARPRVIMAMFEMLVTAVLQGFVVSLGLGIGMMIRVSILGGLLVWVLAFLSSVFVFCGVAAGLTALVTLSLPSKHRKFVALFTSLLYFVGLAGYLIVQHWFPAAITWFANVFIQTAQHPFQPGGEAHWFFIAILFGLVIGTVPMVRAYGKILVQSTPVVNTNAKVYYSAPMPDGLHRVFFWRERIAISRNLGMLIVSLIGIVALFFVPSTFQTWVFIYYGIQLGATVLSFGPPRSLAILYTAPVSPWQLWKARTFAMLPLAAGTAVAFMLVSGFRLQSDLFVHEVCGASLLFAGLLGVSFLLMFDPSLFTRQPGDKQPLRQILISIVFFSFAPIGLAALATYRPWTGVVVNFGIIFLVVLYGRRMLEAKKSVRYLFH